jgi:hypothetical protein
MYEAHKVNDSKYDISSSEKPAIVADWRSV